ncbi:MAG TPA: DUF362 domain-containing protein [bacterium (Candidatus Stahlbacteria)]|nr:DUF362 domain-containing protein [Candidatus Stahlbacteria bacterium]
MRSKVAVLFTRPETVVDDIGRLMDLAEFWKYLPKGFPTILKINISWHYYFPACSTTPWQLEGVTKKLLSSGHKDLIPAQNRTVVVNPEVGAVKNHQVSVAKKYGLKFLWLYRPGVRWIRYHPKSKLMVLDKVFPKGIEIPECFIGKNAVHLPTLKTHVFTTTTGAMKNAFGGLLNENRHWTHRVIHRALVDLLRIQREIHRGIFAVTDGTIAGNGAGPRAMEPVEANLILASGDMVAIDAISAKIMGFDPMRIDYIRIGHEEGLGVGDPDEIEIVGDDIGGLNLKFRVRDTFASRGQKAIYWGRLRPMERILLRSSLVPWSYLASRLYHDYFWYPFIGRKRIVRIEKTGWYRLFQSYG